MKLVFRLGNMEESLKEGVRVLADELGFSLETDQGISLHSDRTDEPMLEITSNTAEATIRFSETAYFYRGLGLLVERLHENEGRASDFQLAELPQFTMNGAMFDCSRNAVFQGSAVKKLIRSMALMGLNTLMLYTEDTYEAANLPYFGYMRGRYTQEELKDYDDYAHLLGVEIIPCIQTLAHLAQALKWNYAADMKDNAEILLVGEPKTYEFIENMIASASSPFRTRRIHIGMDEAHQLGLGNYLDKNGYRNRFDIMNEHLHQVVGIARKYGLQPMIWSDMYFRLGSKHSWYYDLEVDIPKEVIQGMPEGVQFVYWDYYHDDPAFYEAYVDIHRTFGSDPVFAGGIWTWNGISPNYSKTVTTSNAALEACKRKGVREVLATLWGDNGSETNLMTGMYGLQLFAEHGFSEATPTPERLKQRFKICTGADADDFLALNAMDETPGVAEGNMNESNPSKYLLWQDILLGLFDANIAEFHEEISAHYSRLKERLEITDSAGWETLFAFYKQLAEVLAQKAGIGVRLKSAYDSGDREALRGFVETELPELDGRIRKLRDAHRELWFDTYKPFGWETIDIRYGGLIGRIENAIFRLGYYLDGRVDKIEELEVERLLFDWQRSITAESSVGRCNEYHRIVTAGAFSIHP
jgi:hexosaminidase